MPRIARKCSPLFEQQASGKKIPCTTFVVSSEVRYSVVPTSPTPLPTLRGQPNGIGRGLHFPHLLSLKKSKLYYYTQQEHHDKRPCWQQTKYEEFGAPYLLPALLFQPLRYNTYKHTRMHIHTHQRQPSSGAFFPPRHDNDGTSTYKQQRTAFGRRTLRLTHHHDRVIVFTRPPRPHAGMVSTGTGKGSPRSAGMIKPSRDFFREHLQHLHTCFTHISHCPYQQPGK